jgi:hypothetical protein
MSFESYEENGYILHFNLLIISHLAECTPDIHQQRRAATTSHKFKLLQILTPKARSRHKHHTLHYLATKMPPSSHKISMSTINVYCTQYEDKAMPAK